MVLDLDKPVHYALGKLTTSYNDLDFEGLVAMRGAHQTRQAATGVRTQHTQMRNAAKTPETIRKQLIRRFHEILREGQEEVAVGTGCERKARWVSAKGGQASGIVSRDEPGNLTGNSFNAVAVATTATAKVCFGLNVLTLC